MVAPRSASRDHADAGSASGSASLRLTMTSLRSVIDPASGRPDAVGAANHHPIALVEAVRHLHQVGAGHPDRHGHRSALPLRTTQTESRPSALNTAAAGTTTAPDADRTARCATALIPGRGAGRGRPSANVPADQRQPGPVRHAALRRRAG
jgi:hypothetical protein